MKMTLTIWTLLLTGMVYSQNHFTSIDNTISRFNQVDEKDPASLAAALTANCHTEKEKVKAIFHWIATNISYYKPVARKNRKNSDWRDNEPEMPDAGELKPVTERVAIKVLQDKRTICDGYARLFKSLCDHAGIVSEIVTGYARSDMERMDQKFRSNHSWNAVYIDSAWHLLDVTWASGFISRSTDEFIKFYDEYYFLTAPGDFIRHHYPDDLRWTLLDNPPPLFEFRYMPFRQRSFVKYDIMDYYPARGIIEASVGDTIHLELETAVPFRNISIVPDSLWDSLTVAPTYAFVKPDVIGPGRKVSYTFPVNSEAVEWLHVMYNNDAVLRYRLNIKKK